MFLMRIVSKLIALCLISLFIYQPVYAQSKDGDGPENSFHWLYDSDFNNFGIAFAVNGEFVKNPIGIDLSTLMLKKDVGISMNPVVLRGIDGTDNFIVVDPKKLKEKPLVINGVEYKKGFINLSSSEVKLDLVSLDSLRNEFYPDLKAPCMYMINERIIFNDSKSYRIDRGYVLAAELVSSSEIEDLKGVSPFNVVRIYTKTKENIRAWHEKHAVRIR